MPDDDPLDAVERWFRSRGIPHFIDEYSASRDVLVAGASASPPSCATSPDVAALVDGTPAAALRAPAGASPAGTPVLGRRQWGNVGLVVLFTQGVQMVLTELRQAFVVRAVYLAARSPDG